MSMLKKDKTLSQAGALFLLSISDIFRPNQINLLKPRLIYNKMYKKQLFFINTKVVISSKVEYR